MALKTFEQIGRGAPRSGVALALLITSLVAIAPMPTHAGAAAEAELSLGTVVINQTRSAAGQEFYRLFAAQWADYSFGRAPSLRVFELPSARFGSQITIYMSNAKVMQAFLPFNHDRIRSLAAQASALTAQRVAEVQANALFGSEPDLGPDEFN